jgi:phosphoribosylglycinamide formyltransferase 2
MVTLISQNLTEFDLHARAILGLPIPSITQHGPSASAVILADRESENFIFEGVAEAMAEGADIRVFAKPTCLPNRRMGVALATGTSVEQAIARAEQAAAMVRIIYA